MIVMANPVRVAMVTPIVVILCFLFFGVSHVLWFSPQPGDPVNQGEDETHEENSCISMMTPRCHMNDQENDCSDGSDDGADDEAVEWGATVLLFSCVFVGGHRGALTWLFGLEVGRVVVARCGEGSGSSAGSAATKLAVPRRPRLCVSLPTTARVVMP